MDDVSDRIDKSISLSSQSPNQIVNSNNVVLPIPINTTPDKVHKTPKPVVQNQHHEIMRARHNSNRRSDCPGWRISSMEEESMDYKPPKEVLDELSRDYIFPLKKKSLRFTKAKYFCRLCDYHCDNIIVCRNHMKDIRHVNQKEAKLYENSLRMLPFPSEVQYEVITKLLKRIANEQLLIQEEYDRRKFIVLELETKLAKVVPDAKLTVSGSTLSGFAIKSSNVDIDIVVPPDVKPSIALLAVHKIVQEDDTYKGLINDLSSSYPCICFIHKFTDVEMIVGNASPPARSTNELLSYYNSLDPRAKEIVGCFKFWAKLCNIDNQKRGTLPSHTFPLMAVHFLQQVTPPVLPCLHDLHPSEQPDVYLTPDEMSTPWKSENTFSIGKLWVKMFRYYCIDVKVQGVINIRLREPYIRKEKTWCKRLAIEDPFHLKRNLAHTVSSSIVMDYIVDRFKTSFGYFAIPQMSFGHLYKFINAKLGDNKNSEPKLSDKLDVNGEEVDNRRALEEHYGDDEGIEEDGSSTGGDIIDENRKLTESEMKEQVELSKTVAAMTIDDIDHHLSITDYPDIDRFSSIDEVKKTIGDVSVGLAMKLIRQVEERHLGYLFKERYFTGGLKVPLFCSSCQKSGHTKYFCKEYDLPPLIPLPVINPAFYNKLSEIFVDLKRECEPSYQEEMDRDMIVAELQAFIRFTYPDAVLRLFGSSVNGFGFARSDLDICLSFKGNETGEGLNFIDIIEVLSKKLKRFRACMQVLAITTAKVPIVKFTIKRAMLEADLSLYNILALQNTKLLSMYARIDSRVQILGYGIKYFAKLCNIGDASRGSLSSYAYILIVIHYLQQCNPPVVPVLQELYDHDKPQPQLLIDGWNAWFYDNLKALPKDWDGCGRNKQSIGELWVGLLKYYTETFDWAGNVVTIRQRAPLSRLEKLWTTRCMAIEDPFDLSHNLGAGLSRKMNAFIMKSFIKGREVFGYGKGKDAYPYNTHHLVMFLFDANQLTDGAPPNDRGCRMCGKIGHIVKDCPLKKSAIERKEKDKDRNREPKNQKMNGEKGEKFGKGPEARDQLLDALPKGILVVDLPSEQFILLERFLLDERARNRMIYLGYRVYPFWHFNLSKVSNKGVVFRVPCKNNEESVFLVSRMYMKEDPQELRWYCNDLPNILYLLKIFLVGFARSSTGNKLNAQAIKQEVRMCKSKSSPLQQFQKQAIGYSPLEYSKLTTTNKRLRRKRNKGLATVHIKPSIEKEWLEDALGVRIKKSKNLFKKKIPRKKKGKQSGAAFEKNVNNVNFASSVAPAFDLTKRLSSSKKVKITKKVKPSENGAGGSSNFVPNRTKKLKPSEKGASGSSNSVPNKSKKVKPSENGSGGSSNFVPNRTKKVKPAVKAAHCSSNSVAAKNNGKIMKGTSVGSGISHIPKKPAKKGPKIATAIVAGAASGFSSRSKRRKKKKGGKIGTVEVNEEQNTNSKGSENMGINMKPKQGASKSVPTPKAASKPKLKANAHNIGRAKPFIPGISPPNKQKVATKTKVVLSERSHIQQLPSGKKIPGSFKGAVGKAKKKVVNGAKITKSVKGGSQVDGEHVKKPKSETQKSEREREH